MDQQQQAAGDGCEEAAAGGETAVAPAAAPAAGESGMTPFLTAVRSGTGQAIVRLVENVGDGVLGDSTPDGASCLHLAAERRGDGIVRLILDTWRAGRLLPHVDARDGQGFSPLHVACMHGNVEEATDLLRRGAAVGAKNERGSTPLHWAASRGHLRIVKLLAGVYGAEAAVPAGNGSTPLHWAASKGRRGVMKVLLGTFCVQVDVKDDKGCTPCLMAALNGHIKAVELLLDRFQSKITLCDRKRTNLLHAACEMGYGRLASALIEKYHMSVEVQDRKGLTPLARAAQRNQVEVFRLLVEGYGARLDTVTTNESGLLHVACESGALDVAKILLEEHGFEVDARNANGDTPALLAAACGNADVLALLVDTHGASLDARDDQGIGALHVACERRQSGVASVLLESYGLPADKASPSGATALHVAARGGDTDLVELLTGPLGKADIGLRDGTGSQALHIAAGCGHLGVVKVLVEKAGADLGARDSSDKSALDVAVARVNTEVADYLREALPEGQREQHRCKSRRGFERAGRWMRLARAGGFLQNLALENVYLLPVSVLLDVGRFPSHYDASRKKQLVAASEISPQSQVLLVTHPWESPGNPDPSGKQFSALRRFLDEKATGGSADGGKGRASSAEGGNAANEGFGYVWLSFSCTSANRMRPAFQTHLDNFLTAWCFCDHALVLPETVTRAAEGFAYTDVEGYVERGWCCVELLCTLHLEVPTTMHVALKDALSEAVTNCQLSSPERRGGEGGGEGEGGEGGGGAEVEPDNLPPSSVFELISAPDEGTASQISGERVGSHNERSQGSGHQCSSAAAARRPHSSVGGCMTRAVQAASRRLSSCPADAAAAAAAACSPMSPPAETPPSGERESAASVNGPDPAVHNTPDGGAFPEHREQPTEESAHIANLIWSSGAEAHLDSITRLVADILKSLDDEVSTDMKEGIAPGGEGNTRDVISGERIPEDSKAGLLLARVLNLGMEKQDVDEDGRGGEGGEANACPLLRELYEKLGNFSSSHDRLDAVKTLLLAGCYFEGVRASSSHCSRGPSPEHAKLADGARGLPPSPSSLGVKDRDRECERENDMSGRGRVSGGGDGDRNGRGRVSGRGEKERLREGKTSPSSRGGRAEAAGKAAPLLAGSVPSCHVS